MNEIKSENGGEKTVIKDTKSGGASIIDFDYERYAEVERKSADTDAAAALVLGILSVVLGFFISFLGLLACVVGIVFAVRGRKDSEKRAMATAGLVCSVIGIALALAAIVGLVFAVVFMMLGW